MSIRFQADADVNFVIVQAVRRLEPAISFTTSDEAGFRGLPDPDVLERTYNSGRVLGSHDYGTMHDHFRDRQESGKSGPGLLMVSQDAPIRPVAEAIVLIWASLELEDLRDGALHLPDRKSTRLNSSH